MLCKEPIPKTSKLLCFSMTSFMGLRSGLPQQMVPWYLGEYAEPPAEWERGGQVIAELFRLSRWHIAFSPWGQSSLVMKMWCSLVHHWWASDKKQVVIPVARSWAVLAGYGAELINAHTVSWVAALQPGTYWAAWRVEMIWEFMAIASLPNEMSCNFVFWEWGCDSAPNKRRQHAEEIDSGECVMVSFVIIFL